MKNLITAAGLERLSARLQEKLEQLKLLREEKAHAYHASGDGWHDNPGWVQIGQQEDQLVSEINALQKSISQAVIVQKPCQSDTTVRIGTRLSFELFNAKTGACKQQCITIGGKGEADIRQNIVSADSPIGAALLGMEAGKEKEITLPAGSLKIRILSIEPE